MKNIIIIFTLILVTHLSACGQESFPKLESSELIKDSFNEKEIKELKKILTFFDKQVCNSENFKVKNLNKCYQAYFKRLKDEGEDGNFPINISYQGQAKLFYGLDSLFFNKVWYFSKTWTHNKGDTMKYLLLKPEGSFEIFLSKVAKENKGIEYYHTAFINAGDITPSMVSNILINSEYYNIKQPEIRLIIAIHYLTLNDQYHRKEPYK